ncbi:MAG: MBL fold metallo-hydrolase [Nitrospiraceae bacterium]|nr:MBL fold metallo-hydrolase [Nitrospiraceae bacterium]
MVIERIVVGPLQTNCYVIYDGETLNAVVIDPGDEPEKIIRFIEGRRLTVNYIICTHGHFDHVGAVSRVKTKTGAKVVLNRADLEIYNAAVDQAAFWEYEIEQPPEPDMFVVEGNEIQVGGNFFRVLHTPGHSPGGICLYGGGIILSGDTVFAGSVGRTDFFGGNVEALKQSFRTIMGLPEPTRIFPGHGEASSVGIERKENFFVYEL